MWRGEGGGYRDEKGETEIQRGTCAVIQGEVTMTRREGGVSDRMTILGERRCVVL